MPMATAISTTSSRSAAGPIVSTATTTARSATRPPKPGWPANQETRSAAWGDFDADGDPDLFIGFADPRIAAKVYRNEDRGTRFVDVAGDIGVTLNGVARQAAWIDYDGDGDLDLFSAFRDVANRLLRNDGGRFVDVTAASGIGDTRRSVSGVWWDFDRDGDLDLFIANQEGQANGLYRQDGGRFEDVAAAAGVAGTPRPAGGRRGRPEPRRLRSRR